ncbi:hypothetical protein PVAP13_2KG491805 [Panicum virgatum]|uniref:Uncharacterized protein n=1 Tax=Panicum virgatum TaxID=38727 RepID=A0A8T0WKP7_PANVG|nr:hypothetical protein PVAP13_2KG491805 [Panicum virgatum]
MWKEKSSSHPSRRRDQKSSRCKHRRPWIRSPQQQHQPRHRQARSNHQRRRSSGDKSTSSSPSKRKQT